jgi:hypothetical protein
MTGVKGVAGVMPGPILPAEPIIAGEATPVEAAGEEADMAAAALAAAIAATLKALPLVGP